MDQPAQRCLPRSSIARWLIGVGTDTPDELRPALIQSLYGSLPIFLGGIFNTILVSAVIAARIPTPLFVGWALFELCLGLVRLAVLLHGKRSFQRGERPAIDLYLLLSLLWAASVGFGAFICLASGDWVAATLACLSGSAMVGGMAFRSFGAPRLVGIMILLGLGPYVPGGLVSGEPIMLAVALQIPVYIYAMTSAAHRLNRMLVQTMQSERQNRFRACHDVLTGLLNRAGLEEELERRSLQSEQPEATLFYIDLDGFKGVNDSYGHASGDKLLYEVSQRLKESVRSDDVVARLGGDEFVILTEHLAAPAAYCLGRRLIEAIRGIALLDRPGTGAASVGIAMLPDHGANFETLFQAADGALYDAKSRGGSRCSIAGRRPVAIATGHRRSPASASASASAAA